MPWQVRGLSRNPSLIFSGIWGKVRRHPSLLEGWEWPSYGDIISFYLLHKRENWSSERARQPMKYVWENVQFENSLQTARECKRIRTALERGKRELTLRLDRINCLFQPYGSANMNSSSHLEIIFRRSQKCPRYGRSVYLSLKFHQVNILLCIPEVPFVGYHG